MKSCPDDCSPATKTKQISSQHLLPTLISYKCMRSVCVWLVYPPVIHSASKKAVLSFYIIPTLQARFQTVLSSKWPNRLPWRRNNAALIATTVNTTNSKWNQPIAACRVQVLEFTCSFSHIYAHFCRAQSLSLQPALTWRAWPASWSGSCCGRWLGCCFSPVPFVFSPSSEQQLLLCWISSSGGSISEAWLSS